MLTLYGSKPLLTQAPSKQVCFLLGLAFIFFSSSHLYAAPSKLNWDKINDSRVIGYRIYYSTTSKTESGNTDCQFDQFTVANSYEIYNVNTVEQYITPDKFPLEPNLTYFFVIRAFDASNNESCDSNEQEYLVPADYYEAVVDQCPDNPNKTEPGVCGCDQSDFDSDGDNISDCIDACPNDYDKTTPGECGCGVSDIDTDLDGIADCNDQCPENPSKTEPDAYGCETAPIESNYVLDGSSSTDNWVAVPSISVTDITDYPNSTITIEFKLSANSTEVADITMDIIYDATILSNPAAAIGPAAEYQEKGMITSAVDSETFRVMIISTSNADPISDGIVARVTFDLAPFTTATVSSTSLALNVRGRAPDGNAIGIDDDAGLITFGNCLGDIDGDGLVSIAEVQTVINQHRSTSDQNARAPLSSSEMETLIQNYLNGCPN